MTFAAALPKRSLKWSAVVALVLAWSGAATASNAADGARLFVQNLGDTAIKELTSAKITDSQRVKRMRQLLTANFDVEAVGKSVLGIYYRRTTQQQFKHFLKLYEIYVAHNYAGLFKKYNGEKVEMERVLNGGNGKKIVTGVIRQRSGPPISLEITVHETSEGYKVLDLKVEGVSMPLTHRKQFSSVISRSGKGVAGLIDALEKATKRFEAETPSE